MVYIVPSEAIFGATLTAGRCDPHGKGAGTAFALGGQGSVDESKKISGQFENAEGAPRTKSANVTVVAVSSGVIFTEPCAQRVGGEPMDPLHSDQSASKRCNKHSRGSRCSMVQKRRCSGQLSSQTALCEKPFFSLLCRPSQ